MPLKSNRRGFTLIETVAAMAVGVLIIGTSVALVIAAGRCYEDATTRTYNDIDAVMAMQMIVNDVREAKRVQILSNGDRLLIVFPKTDQHGKYDRHEEDPSNQVTYYVSDECGAPGHSGDCLWRGKGNDKVLVKKHIVRVYFESDPDYTMSLRSVRITVVSQTSSRVGAKRTELTERVVYLRNY